VADNGASTFLPRWRYLLENIDVGRTQGYRNIALTLERPIAENDVRIEPDYDDPQAPLSATYSPPATDFRPLNEVLPFYPVRRV
jgi:hypothetical protein